VKRIIFLVLLTQIIFFNIKQYANEDNITLSFGEDTTNFIKLDDLILDCSYISVQPLAYISTPQIVLLEKTQDMLTDEVFNILNVYWWDLRSPKMPNIIYNKSNSLILGHQNLCYVGVEDFPFEKSVKKTIKYMLYDEKSKKLYLYKLDPRYISKLRDAKKFLFQDEYDISNFKLYKNMLPKSAGFGDITNDGTYDVVIQINPIEESEGSWINLSILTKKDDKIIEIWRSQEPMGSISHLEVVDIDGDAADEIIVKSCFEYCNSLKIYKWQNGSLEKIFEKSISFPHGYQFCVANVDNDKKMEIITLGDSPLNHDCKLKKDLIRFCIYKYDTQQDSLIEVVVRELGSSEQIKFYNFAPIGVSEIDNKWKIIFAKNYSLWRGSNHLRLYYLADQVLNKKD
jgi:hypothetical protein